MQQYFAKNKNLELEQSDHHHIKNVMRMKKGDLINVVFDNVTYLCKLDDLSNEVSFSIIEKKEKNTDIKQIDVAFSLIKEQKLDYLIQKTTEVGVNKLIPFNSKRSVVKIDQKKENVKISRWEKILKEAAEQSFRSNMPKINNIINLKDLINLDHDLKLLCSLNKNTKNIKKVLQNKNKYDKILLVVGPEGGFEESEEKFLMDNGFTSITLGKNVLRAETAALVGLSIIKYELEGE